MKWIYSILITVLLIAIGFSSFLLYLDNKLTNEVVSNTYIEGKKISGLSKEELENFINKEVKSLNESEVVLNIEQGKKKKFKWSELGIEYKAKNLSDKVFYEQQGNVFGKFKIWLDRKANKKEYKITPYFDEDKFEKVVEESFPDVISQPTNASLLVEGNKIIINGGEGGKVVDKNKLKEVVLSSKLEGLKEVNVPLTEVPPKVTKEDIRSMGINKVIASYKAHFDPNRENTVTNIKIAAGKVNGTVLAPGEEFNFDKVVGKRTRDMGYKDSTVFVGGQPIDDVGGGICLVSSVLYNVALYADMEITERHQHGLPVSYVPLGRDATLWYGSKNLRFKNTTGNHVYIQTNFGPDYLEINVFGTDIGKDVYIESEMVEKINPPVRRVNDSNLPAGQEKVVKNGSYGYRSVAYRVVRKNGKEIKREVLSRDYYKPTEKVIHVGKGN